MGLAWRISRLDMHLLLFVGNQLEGGSGFVEHLLKSSCLVGYAHPRLQGRNPVLPRGVHRTSTLPILPGDEGVTSTNREV